MIGKTISHYEILEKLGAGGMGEVYKARDTSLDRLVALKFLQAHIDDDAQARKRFVQEAKAASALDHRNVGTIFEIGQTDGRTFIAMAYYGGESLADEITRGPLPLTRALDIAIQIGEGLAEAHRSDIVHRDIKPGNVIITERSEAKIVDFGLAKLAGQTRITQSGTMVGTLGYMSPEQARGGDVDRRTDIWALGALLYESLVAHPPFKGVHEQAIIYSVLNTEPEPLTAQRAGLPLDIDRIISKAMAKDPADRFQSMDDMLVDLRRLRAEAKSSGDRRAVQSAPSRSRKTAILLAGAGLAVGIAIGIGISKWMSPATGFEPPLVRVVTNSGSDRDPAVSPDGNTIAFASSRTGVSQIWLKQLSTGNEVPITNGDDASPRFSPDGSQVLFTHHEGGNTSLWRVSTVGGQPRRVVNDAIEGAWSPDGSQLAFLRTADGGRGMVWLAGPDGTNAREIYRQPVIGMRGLSWSPNGQELLLAIADPFGNIATRFAIVSTQGDDVQLLDPGAGPAQTGTPIWLGSGDRIAYALIEALSTTTTGQSSRVVERTIRTGKVRELLSLPTTCRDLAVLGPGRLLVGFGQQSQNLVLVDDPQSVHPSERWLTRGGSTDRQPTFSPDGRHIMFSSNRSGNLDLWVLDVQTGLMTRLTDDPAQDWDPSYAPDGRSILWSSDRTGNFEIWTAALDGSGARQISHDGVGAENPCITSDGSWVVYSSYRTTEYDLWRMHPDGSDPQLVANGMSMADTSTRPDVLVAANSTGVTLDRGIHIIRVDDGTTWAGEIPLARSFDILTGRPRWVGTNRIAYIDRGESSHFGVMICDVAETGFGVPRPLAGFDPLAPTETFDVTNDGRHAVLSVRNRMETIAVAENVPGIDIVRSGVAR